MRTNDRDDLVGDVADALTLDQPVQWERVGRLAAGAERAQIENLRVIERVLASRPVAGPAAETVPATRFYGRAGVRHAVHALIALASLEVAATLLLLPWAWGDYYRVHGEVAAFMTTKFVGHAAAAGLLLWAGRGDWRTWLLGVYSLFKAAHAPLLMLPAFVLEVPPPAAYAAYLQHLPDDSRLLLAFYVPVFLFAPAVLWAFARECPRVHRRTWLDDLARRMVPASVLIGVGLWVACAVTLALARAGYAAPVALVIDGTVVTQDLLVLGAVILVALRAHTASADEVRRVVVFSVGFLLLMGLSTAYNVAEVFAPGDWVSNYRWSPTILVMEVLRFPGFLLLWYAVLAARIPHLREAVRALYRRLLRRRGRLGAVAAVPAVALAWLIGRSPERAVGAVLADPLAQALVATVGILLLVIAARDRLLSTWTPGSSLRPRTSGRPWPTRRARWRRPSGARPSARSSPGRCGAGAARPRPCWWPTTPRPAPAGSAPRRPGSCPCRARRPSSTCWKRPVDPCGSSRPAGRRSFPCCRPLTRPGSPRRAPT